MKIIADGVNAVENGDTLTIYNNASVEDVLDTVKSAEIDKQYKVVKVVSPTWTKTFKVSGSFTQLIITRNDE